MPNASLNARRPNATYIPLTGVGAWRRGLASGVTQILGLASEVTQILALGNAKIYQHVGISNAKFWRRGHCPTPTPDTRYFASQWNIGLKTF